MHNEPYISVARGFVKLIFAVQQFKWGGARPHSAWCAQAGTILRSGAPTGEKAPPCHGARGKRKLVGEAPNDPI